MRARLHRTHQLNVFLWLCCRLTNTQFSMDELTAIVQEAAAAGTYVAAHAYTPPAITRALAAGVKSIEHGNWLDEDTAQLMAGVLQAAAAMWWRELC
jgi:imidazolonepropionase-like amidohydrolase